MGGAGLKVFLLPSLIFILLSFGSFRLGIKMSMPRVATSMIALLNLTSLKNALTAKLPQGGEPAWLDEYMMLGQFFMFFNMLCHMLAFYFDGLGKTGLQKFVDSFSLQVMFSLFVSVTI